LFSTFFLFNQAQDDYEILYSNMSLPDASAAAAKLKDAKAPFKLADGGTTILVPRNRRNELILETASELNSEQTVNLAQIPPVLQGEIQKEWVKKINTDSIAGILRSIRGIKNARVIVSQPEHSVFTDKEEPATASVMLMVEPGFRLREDQIKVIKNLVAHAVPGLKSDNVVIADNSGNPLEGPNGPNGIGYTDSDTKRVKFEEDVTKKVLAILTPVVGKDNAVVSVSASLNFDQAQAKIHRVIPTGGTPDAPSGVPVSSQEQAEEYTGGGKPEGGVPGAESNTGQTGQSLQTQSGQKENNNYKLTKKTTNFVNSEEDRNVIYAGGNIERMTVAVVLNKVLTAKETEEIRQLVENAAGVDSSRGDSVDIKGFQFSQIPGDKDKAIAEATKTAQDQSFILQIVSVAGVVLLGLAALFIFYVFLKRPVDAEVVEDDDYDYNEPDVIESEPIELIQSGPDPEIEQKRTALNNVVEKDPSEAARVLISYIKG
ncbi:MAG: flagellar M-ring protein FliF, partial [Cyanobacteria bacterium]|nr:flagellar M-ring protein FliF [Cyanobacteriota bacterium]